MQRLTIIFALVLLSLLLTSSWARAAEPPAFPPPYPSAAPAPPARPLTFLCENGRTFTAEFIDANRNVLITLDAATYKLPQALSASGARYSDGHLTVWFKGEGAFVEKDGKIILKDCTLQK